MPYPVQATSRRIASLVDNKVRNEEKGKDENNTFRTQENVRKEESTAELNPQNNQRIQPCKTTKRRGKKDSCPRRFQKISKHIQEIPEYRQQKDINE